MKKIFLLIILLVLVGFIGSSVLAQEVQKPVPLFPERLLPELPSPGFKYGDFFHFLDRWGEEIHEFFIFNPEARAVLQARLALERIAEINTLLEEKGANAPGLDWTQERVRRNMARVNEIFERQRAQGIEVAQMAKRLEIDFDVRQELLESVFGLEKDRLGFQKKEIRLAIKEARAINDFERIAELRNSIEQIKIQKEQLGARKDDLSTILDIEEEKMELKMEIAERDLNILGDEMEYLFDERQRIMEKRFGDREMALELQEETLEIQLRQAVLAENPTLIEEIRAKLIALEAQEQAIEQEQEIEEIVLEYNERQKRGIIRMREKSFGQIQDAKQEIFDVRREITEMIEDEIIVEAPIAVLEMISQAEGKLAVAEQAFIEENYGKSFGQAIAAEKLAINAERILEEKEEKIEKLEEVKKEVGEIIQTEQRVKETQKRLEQTVGEERKELEKEIEEARQEHQERLREIEERQKEIERAQEKARERERERRERMRENKIDREERRPGIINCQTDWDCRRLICTMVIGQDTPQCGPEGICICGPGLEEI